VFGPWASMHEQMYMMKLAQELQQEAKEWLVK